MAYDARAIEKSITEAVREMELSDNAACDIAFHMTDWLEDCEKLKGFYEDPASYIRDQASDILMGFLLHVPNHVAAALKLISGLPVTDVFAVGAVSEN